MKEIKQEIENNISRLNVLIRKKNEEINILKREVTTLKEEKWKYGDLRDKITEKLKKGEDGTS